MTKEEFLEDKYIKCFIKWFIEKLTSGFSHSYNTKKPKKEYNFKSIYEAYEKYEWNGKNLDENNNELKQWSDLLTKSIENNNETECKNICRNILKWGGINKTKIITETPDLIGILKEAKIKLSKDEIHSHNYYNNILMSTGLSKIYSLYIPDFIIYDSRVGAAICHLVREFCIEKKLDFIPENLKFAYTSGKSKSNRNPNTNTFKFTYCSVSHKYQYIITNIKANWLLKEILNKSSLFKNLREIEAALFMIGYEIPTIS